MKKLKFFGALAISAVVMSGCGTAEGASVAQAGAGTGVPASVKDLAAAAGQPQSWQGPKTSPPMAKNKFVVSIPCSMASGCAPWDAGVHAAGDALGWKVQTIDPAFDPAKMNQAIQQAIDLHADAIVTWVVDPTLVASSIAAARAKGIVVVSGATAREDGPVTATGPQHGVSLHGVTQGQWVAAQVCTDINAEGQVQMITDPSYEILTQRVNAVKDYLSKNCPKVALKVQQVSANDIGTVLQNKVSAFVQTNPDTKGLIIPADVFTTDAVVALQQLGNQNVKIYSIDGDLPSVQVIATGGAVRATVGSALEWAGWATMDNVNRLVEGQPANGDDGVPGRMLTKDDLPQGLTYKGDLDYKAMYTKLWKTGSL
ncbi:sugar ABC transporter substrate-binding protein [bacterium RCC_150]